MESRSRQDEHGRDMADPTDHHADATGPSADEAWARLLAGNERFLSGNARPAPTREELGRLTEGQRPFATILGCSDSRVPPEWIFDAAPGQLFVIRVAGNVFSPEIAGSLQYAGAHLQTPLFVVLGHEGCGAVAAAIQTRDSGARHFSRIQILVDNILPALADVPSGTSASELLPRAVESNVRWTMKQILSTPEGKSRAAEGKLKLVGAVYELATGRVRVVTPE
jgi:carbonic anhydrase